MNTQRKRLMVIVSLGVVLLVGIVFYQQFFLLRPIGNGPAGPSVSSQSFLNPWSNKVVRIVGIGDSITAGLGARSREHTFFNRLIKNPVDEYADMKGICLSAVLPNLQQENLAISGSTSREHLTVIEERLSIQDSSIFGLVVLTTGGNDLIHNYGRTPPKECAMYGATSAQAEPWIDAFRKRLNEMLDRISASFPGGCEIYIGDIYDPTDGVGDAPSVYLPHWPDGLAIHAKYNGVIAECATSHSNVHVVPLHQTFMGHGAHCKQFWRSTYVREDPHYWFYVGDAPSVYLPHWPDGLAIHAKYNGVIAECATSHSNVHVVPLHQTFMGHGAHCKQFWRSTYVREDPHYWFYDNIEDPNDRGYDAIRRVFMNTILQRSSLSPVANGQ